MDTEKEYGMSIAKRSKFGNNHGTINNYWNNQKEQSLLNQKKEEHKRVHTSQPGTRRHQFVLSNHHISPNLPSNYPTLPSQATEEHLPSKVSHLIQSATPIDLCPQTKIPASTSPYTTNEHVLSIYSDNTKIPMFKKRKLCVEMAKVNG